MELTIGIASYCIILITAALSANYIQNKVPKSPWKYVSTICCVVISFLVVWNVEMRIPFEQSVIRQSGDNLNYWSAAVCSFVKYFGLCMLIFSFTGNKTENKSSDKL
ncbi:MAG: hypothetical protein KUG78_02785 [Kangiellaceae bacterium]|nr:hypothetical protein [Kangiellaceae bacterium]